MEALRFDDGAVSYTVNGKETISFNPTSSIFVGKFFDMLDNIQHVYEEAEENAKYADARKMFSVLGQRDVAVREQIDAVFGAGANVILGSDACALADGLPVWMNFALAVVDVIDANVEGAEAKARPRMAHYEAKFAKYQRK